MPIYIVLAKTPDNPVHIDHVNAPDLATAQTMVTNAINRGIGINNGQKSQISVAIVQAGVAFNVNPT